MSASINKKRKEEAMFKQQSVAGTIEVDGPPDVQVYMAVTIQPLAGYVSITGTVVAAALAASISKLSGGQHGYRTGLLGISQLCRDAAAQAVGISQTHAE